MSKVVSSDVAWLLEHAIENGKPLRIVMDEFRFTFQRANREALANYLGYIQAFDPDGPDDDEGWEVFCTDRLMEGSIREALVKFATGGRIPHEPDYDEAVYAAEDFSEKGNLRLFLSDDAAAGLLSRMEVYA